jgi:hypothetical protein
VLSENDEKMTAAADDSNSSNAVFYFFAFLQAANIAAFTAAN